MKTKYMPVDPDFFDLIEREKNKDSVKVVYFAFTADPELDDTKGKVVEVENIKDDGTHLVFDNGVKVRIDRIVALNGIPGPAYDEYDSFGLAPLTCEGGYSVCKIIEE